MIGNHLEPFKFWCQKVLPNVYDDSLSYYEYLCKLNEYLNEVIGQINTLTDNMEDYESDLSAQWLDYKTELTAEWQETKTYIDNYFNNLDVQQEINNKLDQMASDGTLDAILLPYFNAYKSEINGIVSNQNIKLTQQDGKIDLLDERVTAIASLPSGSTSGDAELIDIRVPATGFNENQRYNDAGDAVRGQVSELNNSLAKIYNSKTFNTINGTVYYAFNFYNGKSYTIINNGTGGLSISTKNATTPEAPNVDSINYIAPNSSATFTATGNAIYLRLYCTANGTATVNENGTIIDTIIGNRLSLYKILGASFGSQELTDLNNAPNDGLYIWNGTNDNKPSNYPQATVLSGFTVIETIQVPNSSNKIQKVYSTQSGLIFERQYVNNTWSNWISNITTDLTKNNQSANAKTVGDRFAKTYSRISDYFTGGIDLNDIADSGVKLLLFEESNKPLHFPSSDGTDYYGFLINFTSYYNLIYTQLFIASRTHKIWFRKYDNSAWSDWVLLNGGNSTVGNYYTCLKSGGDFNSLVQAINTVCEEENATLYVGDGTWDLIDELGSNYVDNVGDARRGLVLKNNVHIICSSKCLITCKYTGSRTDTREWLSAFNSGVKGFTLENARIETDNIRYTIHDERGEATDFYQNTYINCYMKHTNGFYRQVIGGGLGIDGHIIVKDCYFENDKTDTPNAEVSWHNSADGWYTSSPSKNAQSFVDLDGNYFKNGTAHFIQLGNSTKLSTVLVHGNSVKSAPYVDNHSTMFVANNIEMIAYNNEIRP